MKNTSLITALFAAILQAYKHILPWILAKIGITILSYLIAFVCIVPFICCVIIIGMISPIDWLYVFQSILPGLHSSGTGNSISSYELLTLINENIVWVVIISGVMILGALVYFIMTFIGVLLHTQYLYELLYNNRKGVLTIFQGIPLSIKTYIAVVLGFLFRLCPLIILFIVAFVVVSMSLGETAIQLPSMLIGSILGVLSILALLFIAYRNMFVFVVYAHQRVKGEKMTIKEVFRSSRNLTNGWSFFIKCVTVLICITIILIPLRFIGNSLKHQEKKIVTYINYAQLPEYAGEYSDSFIASYASYTDTELNAMYQKWSIINFIFSIFYILFIDGLLLVGLISLHQSILHKHKFFPGKS